MKISQIPEKDSFRIMWLRPFQPLKSPMTATPLALGAQTAK